MKIIDKYITSGFIWPFLYCLIAFVFLYMVSDVLSRIDTLVKQDIPFEVIKNYYFSSFPLVLVQTAPFAMLLATVFLLSNLNRHNEIIALRASGVDTLRIISPLLIIGLAISLGVFLINDRFVPQASVTMKMTDDLYFRKYKWERNQQIENVTIFGKDGRLFYARTYDIKNKVLHDIVLLEHDKNQVLKRKISAQRMEWTGDKWRFIGCDIFRFDKEGKSLGKPAIFRTPKIIQFGQKPEDLLKEQTQPEFMNYGQLKEYVRILDLESKSTARKLLVDMYYKLSVPFTGLVIMLIGIPFVLKRTRAKTIGSAGIALAISIIYYVVNAMFLALGKGGLIPPVVAAFAANVGFAAFGIYLIGKLRT
ncbi:MAG: LptF/LptG family permease [Candidatus Omnitrophica bacterium]|nr:LptF/LptG family permease [Candidatus Omnitrophota bacterium]